MYYNVPPQSRQYFQTCIVSLLSHALLILEWKQAPSYSVCICMHGCCVYLRWCAVVLQQIPHQPFLVAVLKRSQRLGDVQAIQLSDIDQKVEICPAAAFKWLLFVWSDALVKQGHAGEAKRCLSQLLYSIQFQSTIHRQQNLILQNCACQPHEIFTNFHSDCRTHWQATQQYTKNTCLLVLRILYLKLGSHYQTWHAD